MPTTFTGGRGVSNQDLDIPKRMSFVIRVKTPEQIPIGAIPPGGDGGAIREGGMPVLTSKENLGLLFEYAAVGLIYGQENLNCSGSQVTATTQLVVLPWSFKVFYGILSDCRPICGYRSRPYMLIGWAISFIMLLVMCIMPIGKLYFTDAADRDVDVSDYTPEIEAHINYDAPSEGAKYVMLMFFAAFGYVMADVCADSITCELAQREPLDKRGKTQSCIYTVRTVMVIVGELLTGFFFYGEDYGGTFNFSLSSHS
ncbi:hypothetical protein PHMEG_00040245 [Phytophthora megakarya]|uniref:Transmembrane protein n=1 Tax=Phytophthora megakarya TaxID=4795 RepID=A0A225UDT2_9STRA|nr:hypothetical protein PHMEG_00040245 [Phytophthora megakarya]